MEKIEFKLTVTSTTDGMCEIIGNFSPTPILTPKQQEILTEAISSISFVLEEVVGFQRS